MRLNEWIGNQGVNEAIYKLAENAYKKGYNDGLMKVNQIFQDDQMDKIATGIMDHVFAGGD